MRLPDRWPRAHPWAPPGPWVPPGPWAPLAFNGATHSAVLKTGFGGGIDFVLAGDPTVILGAAIMYYPDAQQGLTDRVNKDSGSSYTTVVDGSVNVQPAVSISILWPRTRR